MVLICAEYMRQADKRERIYVKVQVRPQTHLLFGGHVGDEQLNDLGREEGLVEREDGLLDVVEGELGKF